MNKCISFKTNFGWISAIEEEDKIISIKFEKKTNKSKSVVLNNFKKNLISYFNKKTKFINIRTKIIGTPMQKKVWNEVKKIKYGSTKSYGAISKKLNISPRLVGKICGQNQHLLLVPCHRVIRSDGTLGGFSGVGGIKTKKKLLKNEGFSL